MSGRRTLLQLGAIAIAAGALASSTTAAPEGPGFQGTGNTTLPAFRLTHAETLRWQTSGGILGGSFALRVMNPWPDLVNPQLVFAKGRNGSVRLGPGRYLLRVTVLPGTSWKITIA